MSPVTLDVLLAQAVETGAFDLHLVSGQPPVFRISGSLQKNDGPPLTSHEISEMVLPYLPEPTRTQFASGNVAWVETLISSPDAPQDFDLRVFRAQNEVSASIRAVLSHLPTLEQIGGFTTPLLQRAADQKSGLILFTGPHNSGKLTTSCAVVEASNASRAERIFLIEDSPAYRFASKQSLVTRWQIGPDVDSVETAARRLWKCDANVVHFAELSTPEYIQHALYLANTGHLVLATLAAESAQDALEQIATSFGAAQPSLQKSLARTLVAVFNQRLLSRADRPGRAALYEVYWAGSETRAALQKADTIANWQAILEADENTQTRAQALAALQEAGIVSDGPPAPQ